MALAKIMNARKDSFMSDKDIEPLRDRSMLARAKLQHVRLELRQAKEELEQAAGSLAKLEKICAAESERLQRLETGRGDVLAQCGQVTVYEFWIEVPGYKGPIAGASATFTQHGDIQQVSDVRSRQKSGLGGGIVGGLLLGPVGAAAGVLATRKNQVSTLVREVDTRELEFAVSGPGFAWSCRFPYGDTESVRALKDVIVARGSSPQSLDIVIDKHRATVANLTDQRQHQEHALASRKAYTEELRKECERCVTDYQASKLPLLEELRFSWDCLSSAKQYAILLFGPILIVAWTIAVAVLFGIGSGSVATYVAGLAAVHVSVILGLSAVYLFRNRW